MQATPLSQGYKVGVGLSLGEEGFSRESRSPNRGGGVIVSFDPPPQLLKSDFFYRTLIFIKEKYDSNIEKTRAG